MAKFGKDRFPENYQNFVGMRASEKLHKNSMELLSILKEHNILIDNMFVFEIGMGPGRNLHYLINENPTLKLGGNDLFVESSFNTMSDEVKNNVNFIESDTEDLFKERTLHPHLLISSDHLMHLQYEKADFILKQILNKWKPAYILLREVKKEAEAPEHPRLYHNYSMLLESYDLIFEGQSEQDNNYFIWLLKIK